MLAMVMLGSDFHDQNNGQKKQLSQKMPTTIRPSPWNISTFTCQHLQRIKQADQYNVSDEIKQYGEYRKPYVELNCFTPLNKLNKSSTDIKTRVTILTGSYGMVFAISLKCFPPKKE